jgi:hypothetical protein
VTSQYYPVFLYAVQYGAIPLSHLAGADVLLGVDGASPTLGDGTLLVTLSYFLAPTV